MEDLDTVIESYRDACGSFAVGDPAPIKDLYSRSDDATLANPFGSYSLGWPSVSDALDFASSNFRDGGRPTFERIAAYRGTDLATILEHETWETKVGGRDETSTFDLRVTTTFRLEDGSWKVVERHADNLVSHDDSGPIRTRVR
jgi:ketosteroid isomerase-like protein